MEGLVIYPWKTLNIKKFEKRLDAMLRRQRSRIAALLRRDPPYTWENLVAPLDDLADELHKLRLPYDLMADTMTPRDQTIRAATRNVYRRCMRKLYLYGSELLQNQELYAAYKSIAEGEEWSRLNAEQQSSIRNTIAGAFLTGVELPPREKKLFKQVSAELSALEEKFGCNLADATSAWSRLVTDVSMLDGLLDYQLKLAQEAAQAAGHEGYLFSFRDSTHALVMANAKNRNLRREFYEAATTLASNQGPNAGKFDNGPIIKKIRALRHKKAKLLGFSNYAELALQRKMVRSTTEVMDFLGALALKAKKTAAREYKVLAAYAKKHDGVKKLQVWDIQYYLERVKQEKFAISEDKLTDYFPVNHVLKGMFSVATRLYGITFKKRRRLKLWHPDVKLYNVFSREGKLIGGLYLDLFERPGEKSGGQWMEMAVARRELKDGSIQLPIAYIISDFTPQLKGVISLLPFELVTNLFHEFGHSLHLLLTEARVAGVSGMKGIPEDGYELPSQFMEFLCCEREVINLISKHHETGRKLSIKLFQKMRASQKFGMGISFLDQLELSLLDFRLHLEYTPSRVRSAYALHREVNSALQPLPLPRWVRQAESFEHCFSNLGGYDSGYYGYLWSNVLAADAYAMFIKSNGRIDWSVGEKFRHEVLSRGGSRPFMDSFIAFRGRAPSVESLLRWYGFIK